MGIGPHSNLHYIADLKILFIKNNYNYLLINKGDGQKADRFT